MGRGGVVLRTLNIPNPGYFDLLLCGRKEEVAALSSEDWLMTDAVDSQNLQAAVMELWDKAKTVQPFRTRCMPAVVMMRNAHISQRCQYLRKRLEQEGQCSDETNSMLKKMEEQLPGTLSDVATCNNWERLHREYAQACRLNWGAEKAEPVIAVGVRDAANMSVMMAGFKLVDVWMQKVKGAVAADVFAGGQLKCLFFVGRRPLTTRFSGPACTSWWGTRCIQRTVRSC